MSNLNYYARYETYLQGSTSILIVTSVTSAMSQSSVEIRVNRVRETFVKTLWLRNSSYRQKILQGYKEILLINEIFELWRLDLQRAFCKSLIGNFHCASTFVRVKERLEYNSGETTVQSSLYDDASSLYFYPFCIRGAYFKNSIDLHKIANARQEIKRQIY